MKISVVTATRNRGNRLGKYFSAFERMRVPRGLDWELIVVNNASTDDTVGVTREYVARTFLPLKLATENRIGVSSARNTGISLANGDVVAIIDDDCYVEPDWLEATLSIFALPDIDLAGGPVLLHNPQDLPVSIRTATEIQAVTRMDEIFYSVPGCNMAARREVYESIGGYDPNMGPGRGLAAEDSDLLYRALCRGYRIWYRPEMRVQHAHGRRTLAQQKALERSYVIGRGGFYAKHLLGGDPQAMRALYWELTSALSKRGTDGRKRNARNWPLVRQLMTGFLQVGYGKIFLSRHRAGNRLAS